MKIGIVGSEGAKFTKLGEERAKEAITALIMKAIEYDGKAPTIVSGECHLGGIDIWAKEIAKDSSLPYEGYPPREHTWSGGYKPRNLQIAHNSDKVYCITVDKLPPDYKGMTFKVCYHCQKAGRDTNHIKSGGCWTALQALKKGKQAEWIVIENE